MYWAGWIARAVIVVTMASAAVTGFTHTPRAMAAEDQAQAKTAKSSQAPKMPKSMGQLSKMDPVMVFKMLDRENKGYVTREEFMKFAEEVWNNMDNNRDGKVDRPEWTGP